MATYIPKATLEFSDLWKRFGIKCDNGGRWCATEDSPEYVREYLATKRSPSRAFPHSHSKALLTQKFAKVVVEQDPELAVKLGLAE